jgi:hypothetical protein
MALNDQREAYLDMLDAKNKSAFESRAKFFVETCKDFPPNRILNVCLFIFVI